MAAAAAAPQGGAVVADDLFQALVTKEEVATTLRAYKGYVTRSLKDLERLKYAVAHDPTDVAVRELQDAHARLQHYVRIVEAGYTRLLILDPGQANVYNGKIDELLEERDAASDDALRVLANSKVKPQPAIADPLAGGGAGGGAAAGRIKANDILKPPQLSLEYSPEEMRIWAEKFKAFYASSKLDTVTVGEQQAYLIVCLDNHLASRLRDEIRADTPVLGDDSCMKVLEQEFLNKYPLFNRRLKFFQCKQSHGQAFSDFATTLRKIGDEAELGSIGIDELYVFKFIGGCADPKLKEKFLKEEDPSWEDLKRVFRAYERAQVAMKAETKSSRTDTDNRGRRYGRGKGKGKSHDRREKCYRCGAGNHPPAECPHKGAFCYRCEKQGHIDRACAWQRRGRSSSRGREASSDRATRGGGRRSEPRDGRGRSREPSKSREATPSPDKETRGVKENKSSRIASVSCAAQGAGRGSIPVPDLNVHFSTGKRSFTAPVTPDTGSTRTIFPLQLLHEHNVRFKKVNHEKLYAADGNQMACEGVFTCWARSEALQDDVPIDAIVSSAIDKVLLSWHDLIALQVIPEGFPHSVCQRTTPTTPGTTSTRKTKLVDFAGLKEAMLQKYPTVLQEGLGENVLEGEPMQIHLRKDIPIKPKKVMTARSVPRHRQEKAQKLIQQMVNTHVLQEVTVPTQFCSASHFVDKPNGGVRLTTDYKNTLNPFVCRPVHPFPTTEEILQQIEPTSQCFAKLDAVSGYFQIPLDEESSFLTTFLTPWGRYRYLRAPMGLSASSDEWCYRSDRALEGLPGVLKLVDDVLVQAPDEEILRKRLNAVLRQCEKKGITISSKKFAVGSTIHFAGHVISPEGIRPDDEKLKSIRNFPVPTNISELRSFLGLANQLGNFLPDLAQASSTIRTLLKKDMAWNWLPEHQKEFDHVKTLLTSNPVVAHFNPELPSVLLTDASRLHGTGYALMQNDRLIRCGSQSLTSAESRYSTIELEMLGLVKAVRKCRYYLHGGHFKVLTDHRPLVGIFKKDLGDIPNPRLQRLREKVAEYTFDVEWIAGKDNLVADALSRAPVFPPDDDEELGEAELNVCLATTAGEDADDKDDAEDPMLEFLLDAARLDHDYQKVLAALQNGQDVQRLPPDHPARQYRQVWDNLSIWGRDNNKLLVYDAERIVIPAGCRREILQRLHLPHAGIVKTRKMAQQLYYWPGMSRDISMLVEKCQVCLQHLPSKPRIDPVLAPVPDGPMDAIGTDLMEVSGTHYLIVVDRFSGFIWVNKLTRLDTAAVTSRLDKIFQDYGYPRRIRSDGGPQFRAEFREFCKEKGIVHELSSPYHPQSNGLAEAAVKQAKFLLLKTKESGEDFATALSAWRITPRPDGGSPAHLFFGRRPRSHLPELPSVHVDLGSIVQGREENRNIRNANSGDGDEFLIGDHVAVQNPQSGLWTSGHYIVKSRGDSYHIRMSDGREKLRNKKFIRRSTFSVDDDLASPVQVEERAREEEADKKSDDELHSCLRRSPRLEAKRGHIRF